MRLLRWILVVPGALLFGMVGSFVGGLIASTLGQAAADTASAFLGAFAFVSAAGVIAPSSRGRVFLTAACLAGLLALATFVLGLFTKAEEFVGLSGREQLLTPLAQFLGALYALTIIPPMVTPGTLLEDWWRGIRYLGLLVSTFGLLMGLVGFVAGLLGHGWIGLTVGLGVLLFGVVTHMFPFAHLILRVRRAEAEIKRILRTNAEREDADSANEQ